MNTTVNTETKLSFLHINITFYINITVYINITPTHSNYYYAKSMIYGLLSIVIICLGHNITSSK